MRKKITLFLIGLIVALSAVFSCGIIFDTDRATAKGGIYVEDGGNINISGGNLVNNEKAIYIEGGDHTVKNVSISGSTNGAIYVADGARLILRNSVITNNTNTVNGGAINVGKNAVLILDDCIIKNNSTTGNGGAIYAAENSIVNVMGTTSITGNSAAYGGGIYLSTGALLNDGVAGLGYFAENVATKDPSIWQDVHYKQISLNIEQEYVEQDGTFATVYTGVETVNKISDYVPDFDIGTYTWIQNQNVLDMSVIASNTAKSCNVAEWEGLCDIQMSGQHKLMYTLNADKASYSVRARYTSIAGMITIRSTYKGLPVTNVADYGFQMCNKLTGDLVIPSSITSIGTKAFMDCYGFNGNLVLSENLVNIGEKTFYNCNAFTGSLTIPSSVATIGKEAFAACSGFNGNLIIENGVTTIGDSAFKKCSGFTGALTLPNSIVTIGQQAFYQCSGFNGTLTIGSGVQTLASAAFYGCGFTGELALPNTLTTLEKNIFESCTGITSIVLPQNLEVIGDAAFRYCTGLTDMFTIPSTLTKIGSMAFAGCTSLSGNLVIPYEVVEIGNMAFYNCTNLSSATFNAPNGWWTANSSTALTGNSLYLNNASRNVTYLTNSYSSYYWKNDGKFIFTLLSDDTYSIAARYDSISGELVIPTEHNGKAVTQIAVEGFYDCANLTGNLAIPNSITTIGNHAFGNCSGFNGTLIIGENVTTIGKYAFWQSGGFIGDLVIPDNVTSIGDTAFSQSGFTGTLTLSSNLTVIELQTFYQCGFTGSLVIPDCVTDIGGHAFFGCGEFDGTLTLGSGLQTIRSYAFNYCGKFTGELVIPNNVTNIDLGAFGRCYKFTSVVFEEINGWWVSTDSAATSGTDVDVSDPAQAKDYLTSTYAGNYWKCDGTFKFTLINNKTAYSVAATSTNIRGQITIPTEYNSLPVTEITENGFQNCINIVGNLDIPVTITKINNYAFYKCTGINGVLTIGNNVTKIGTHAFSGCYNFVGSLRIPNSVTSIGYGCFQNTGFDGELVLSENLKEIPDWAFGKTDGTGGYLGTGYFSGGLVIPEGVTSIGYCSFKLNKGFNLQLTIADSVKTIAQSAFSGCNGFIGLKMSSNVESIAEFAFSGCSNISGELVLPDSLTSIGAQTFAYCKKLTSLIIGTGLSVIPGMLFSDCEGLTGLLTIPDNITEISSWAFSNCDFTALEVGNGLKRIGDYAFNGCDNLATASFEEINGWWVTTSSTATSGTDLDMTDVEQNAVNLIQTYKTYYWRCDGAFEFKSISSGKAYAVKARSTNIKGQITIPSEYNGLPVTQIYNAGFQNCTGLIGNLVIPDSITVISGSAFKGCTGFNGTLTLPNGLVTISSNAFQGCTGFTGDLVIPDSVTSIGESCFLDVGFNGTLTISKNIKIIQNNAFAKNTMYQGTTFAGSLVIPEGVTEIGYSAFSNNKGFTGALVIPDSVVRIGATTGSMYNSDEGRTFMYCSGFTSLKLSDNLISIGDNAFHSCTGLTGTLTIPNGITKIEDNTFNSCRNLTGLVIGSGVKIIENYAFADSGCVGELVIPDNVETIGQWAFQQAYNLTSIVIGKGVRMIEPRAFENCTAVKNVTFNEPNGWWVSTSSTATSGTDLDMTDVEQNAVNLIQTYKTYYWHCDGAFKFTLIDNNTAYSVAARNTNITGEITIPSTYNSLPVTKIGSFVACYDLLGVTIPNTITTIQSGAFASCKKMTSIYIPASVTNIEGAIINGGYAAIMTIASIEVDKNNPVYYSYVGDTNYNCIVEKSTQKLIQGSSSTVIPDGVKIIGNASFAGFGNNLPRPNYTYFNYPSSVTTIEDYAYQYSMFILDMIIPNSVVSIGANAFAGNVTSDTVEIPTSVKFIGSNAFGSASKLTYVNYYGDDATANLWTQIEFSGTTANPVYYAKCLYINDVLLENATFAGITKINGSAFVNCETLTSVTFNNGLVEIGGSAFYNSGITGDLVIPASVKAIGVRAFEYCDNLTNVVFEDANSWWVTTDSAATSGDYLDITGTDQAMAYLTNTYAAYYWHCDGTFKFTLIDNNTAYSVAATNTNIRGQITIPTEYNGLPVTEIAENGFQNCTNIIGNLVIPETITKIGMSAFYDCIGLTGTLALGNNVKEIDPYAFQDCAFTGNLIIPDSVKVIAQRAFYGCSGFTGNLVIPDSVTSIGSYAFCYCNGFDGTLTLGESLTNIGRYAFQYGKYKGNLTIPDSVVYINEWAFNYCQNFTSLSLGKSVKEIGNYAFSSCSGLTGEITIPASVKTISIGAFNFCEKITSVVFEKPNSWWVTTDSSATSGTDVDVSNVTNNKTYLTDTYANYYWHCDANFEFTLLDDGTYSVKAWNTDIKEEVVIPSMYNGKAVTQIANRGFQNCTGITKITIPESITKIENYAFDGCTNITTIYFNAIACEPLNSTNFAFDNVGAEVSSCIVTIGRNVTKIPDNLFYRYSSQNASLTDYARITKLEFAEGGKCTTIGSYAFKNCLNLVEITIPESVTSIGSSAFVNCELLSKINYNAIACGDINMNFISAWTIFDNAGKDVGASVERIPARLFYCNSGCSYITEVNFDTNSICVEIAALAFKNCINLTTFTIPASVTIVNKGAFESCTALTRVTFENTSGWFVSTDSSATSGTNVTLTNTTTNVTYLTSTYVDYYWKRSE